MLFQGVSRRFSTFLPNCFVQVDIIWVVLAFKTHFDTECVVRRQKRNCIATDNKINRFPRDPDREKEAKKMNE